MKVWDKAKIIEELKKALAKCPEKSHAPLLEEINKLEHSTEIKIIDERCFYVSSASGSMVELKYKWYRLKFIEGRKARAITKRTRKGETVILFHPKTKRENRTLLREDRVI